MMIRKNSKEFKAIKKIFSHYENLKERDKLIKLFITKVGHSLNDKIEIDSLKKKKEFYYNLTYDAIINNLNSQSHQLFTNNEGLYFFHSSLDKSWDQTPFYLDQKLANAFEDFKTVEKKDKVNEPISSSRQAVKRNQNKDIHQSAKQIIPFNHKIKQERIAKRVHTFVTKQEIQIAPKEEKNFPDYHLKHPIHFHYLDKILFHQLNLTKKDILDYYEHMADYILPYLKERPQFFRWHQGSIKESHYNKSIESLIQDWKGKLPDWIKTTKIYSVTYEEERTYMLCPDKDHLMFLIEIGCIELNPWHSRVKKIEYPDYLIIDLDPFEIDFEAVIEVALTSKEILDTLKIPCYIKTSGNKGMHIYIPLDGKSNYDVSRSLCEFICKIIHLKLPHLTSLLRLPDQRRGRVYLDFLQNSKGKSIVAPYSIRPNETASVATPLEWSEVKTGLKLNDYNYATLPLRLKKINDPFKGIFKMKINAQKILSHLKEIYGFLV
jgi:bifunctional non-homologous end joining protein LigD